ncbi:MAG TPA: hypothetical protein VFO65_12930 [Acidimicrobiales bacterium]|nr:hypothetical protein [Acidimicrobiales bacterium]
MPLDNAPPHAGITRRRLITRSAMVGGAVVWTVPVVSTFTAPAFGQAGTPDEKDISYLAFFYQCVGQPPMGAVVEIDAAGNPACLGAAAPTTPGCTLDIPAGAVAANCADLQISVAGGVVKVSFVGPGGAAFLDSVAKCGQPGNAPDGACVEGVISGFTLTFGPCG